MWQGVKKNKWNYRKRLKVPSQKLCFFESLTFHSFRFSPRQTSSYCKRKKGINLKVFKRIGYRFFLRKYYYFALMIAEFRIKSDHQKFLKKTIMSRLLRKKERYISKVFFKEMATNFCSENIIIWPSWSPNFALKLTTEFSWNEPSGFVFKTDH